MEDTLQPANHEALRLSIATGNQSQAEKSSHSAVSEFRPAHSFVLALSGKAPTAAVRIQQEPQQGPRPLEGVVRHADPRLRTYQSVWPQATPDNISYKNMRLLPF